MRPANLATDNARGIDVVIHALDMIPEADVVVELQPTSPFRVVDDIDGSIQKWYGTKQPVVGVTETAKNPYWMDTLDDDERLIPLLDIADRFIGRQNLPKIYALNGAVSVASRFHIYKYESFVGPSTRPFVMPRERSIDLDSESDWMYSEYLLSYH